MIFHPTNKENIFNLAPIPVYKRVYKDDIVTNRAYQFGLNILDAEQRRMGQELPGQYDNERQSNYEVNYDRQDEWVEKHELQPIGSRFYVNPNDFLEAENADVDVINRRIKKKSFFIQVNTGKEATKSGIFPEDLKSFLELCRAYEINNIGGLMCIPPINDNPKKHFQIISELTSECGLGRPSIGMSSDYKDALEFDPKYIRVGTALFGKRT